MLDWVEDAKREKEEEERMRVRIKMGRVKEALRWRGQEARLEELRRSAVLPLKGEGRSDGLQTSKRSN